ncbi:MAG: RIP metalloprotease RseP [Streptococcaceae bacterium]|jgi:regulator of sigma E protease|nr:RIP metalloprotease RseP [Streptococcaceae bacterium]
MKAIITFIIVFAILVIVHEAGHLFFAKRAGILVREFAIGMGPKLFYHRDKSGTAYTIRLLPIGGHVRMAGWADKMAEINPGMQLTLLLDENKVVKKINLSHKVVMESGLPFEVEKIDLEDKLFIQGFINGDEAKSVTYNVDHDALLVEEDGTEIRIAPKDVQMQSASVPDRILTNFAGPMNNFILGIFLFILLAFMQGGSPVANTNQIGSVQKNSLAQKVGLKAKDYIESVNDIKIANWNDLSATFRKHLDKTVTLKVKRGGKILSLKLPLKTRTYKNEKFGMIIGIGQPMDHSLVNGIILGGFKKAWLTSVGILKALASLLTGFSLDRLAGPVGIFQMSQRASQAGLMTIISLMAMLSMNLGFANLFPIPALDGGKIILNVIEGIRGKPISHEKEGMITLAGVVFMLLLMIAVTWNDIASFFRK